MSAGLPVKPVAVTAEGTYVVKPGDTLLKIARAHQVEFEALKRWNNLSDVNQLTVGQVLKVSPPAAGTPVVADPAPAARPTPPPLVQKGEAAVPQARPPAADSTLPRAPDAGSINWGWPAAGEVVQVFNSNTKGIDIAGSLGDPIQAAANGKVLYSGNGVRGLGNLIIISHPGGFISAYAHNRVLLVKPGQEVKRGTKIAEMGDTDTSSPRVHFEIRRQGAPVDPMQYLPPR
jgi:lipoprotein NlpD